MLKREIYLGLQGLLGSNIRSCYQEFLQLEKVQPAELHELQNIRLDQLLRHAIKNVPFYRERVTDPEIRKFPVLKKTDIREHFLELMTRDLRSEYESGRRSPRYSWTVVKTGGSTGEPTTVIHDKSYRDWGRAGRLYTQALCGFSFGTPYFRLWGSMRDINQNRDSFIHRLQSYLSGERIMNAFRMNDNQMDKYLDEVNGSETKYLMAYVDAAYALAKYSLRKAKPVRSLSAVMACAGTVTPEIRETISRVFGCRVHNLYGSRDCSAIACECSHGGLHQLSNVIYLEVLDESGAAAKTGSGGRVLATLLSNYSFPIIRYEIGDVAAFSLEVCSCGRPFPLLREVEGRVHDFLSTNDGGYVSPVYIRHLIGVVHNPGLIRRFQLVQSTLTDFHLRIEAEQNCNEQELAAALERIIADLKAVFGSSSKILVTKIPEILPSASGKFLYTVNNLDRAPAVSSR